MGSGASKNGGLDDTKNGSGQQYVVKSASTADPNGDGKSGSPLDATSRPRLVCTVEDSKTNQFVPFQSSVQGGNKSETQGDEEDDLSDSVDADVTTTTDSGESSTRFVFGEVTIDLSVVKSPAPLSPVKNAPSARTKSGFNTISERPSAASHTGKVHGLGVATSPWRHAVEAKTPVSTSSSPPAASSEPLFMGDLALPLEGAPGSWFWSPLRFAVPVRYTFTAFAAQSGPIRGLSASADASQVAVVVSGVKQCFLIDTQGTLLLSVKGHLDPVLSCAQSKDGKFLVTTSADCTAVMWDLNNGKKLRELPVSTQVNAVAVSDESDAIATTSTDDVVHLWDAKSCDPMVLFQRHTAGIFSIAFARRGGLVASGSSNGEIYVWSQQNGDVKCFLAKHKTAVLAVSFSNDCHRLASVDRECLRVWDLFTGQCVFVRDTKGNIVYGVDEELGTIFRNEDQSVRYTSCAFVAGQVIAASLTSKQLLLVDPNEGKELLMIPTKALVTTISGSWMSDIVFVGDFAGNIYKLTLQFSARDIASFHLDQKPPAKDGKKGTIDRD